MSTATLAILIGALVLAQAAAALFFGIYRRQAERRALGTDGFASEPSVGLLPQPSANLADPRPAPAGLTPGPASLTRRPMPTQGGAVAADRALAVRFSRSGKPASDLTLAL